MSIMQCVRDGDIIGLRNGDNMLVLDNTAYRMEEGQLCFRFNIEDEYRLNMDHKEFVHLDAMSIRTVGRLFPHWKRNETTYKELTPHEAMIKLMDDGEFECEVRDFYNGEWYLKESLKGVIPNSIHPFIVDGLAPNHWRQCRIKEEV